MEAQKEPRKLLLEIYSDDIPPQMQTEFMRNFNKLALSELKGRNIPILEENIESYITPLRIAYICPFFDQSESYITVKGPKANAPEVAIQGFLKKHNLTDKSALQTEGEYYIFKYKKSKDEQKKELGKIFENILNKSIKYWPKKMNLPNSSVKWVRPIHSIILMLDSEIIPMEFAGIKSSNTTYLSKSAILDIIGKEEGNANNDTAKIEESKIKIKNAGSYCNTIKSNGIILKHEDRVRAITDQLKKKPEEIKQKNNLPKDIELMEKHFYANNVLQNFANKNVYMCENPLLLYEEIDKSFSSLPYSIIAQTMINHQNYLPLFFREFKIPKFGEFTMSEPTYKCTEHYYFAFVIENKVGLDESTKKEIRKGNQNVLSARLKDSQFFLKMDEKNLGDINIIKELKNGLTDEFKRKISYDKAKKCLDIFKSLPKKEIEENTTINDEKLKKLCQKDIRYFDDYNNFKITDLLLLAKADLQSKVVNEFPELQGEIAGVYYSEWWQKNIETTLKEEYNTEIQNLNTVLSDISIMISFQYQQNIENILRSNTNCRRFIVSNAIASISSNLDYNVSYSSSADPFGILKLASNIAANAVALINTYSDSDGHGYPSIVCDYSLESIIYSISIVDLPFNNDTYTYGSHAKEIIELIIKAINKEHGENFKCKALLNKLEVQNDGSILYNKKKIPLLSDLVSEMIFLVLLNSEQIKNNSTNIYTRAKGLSSFSKEQEEYIKKEYKENSFMQLFFGNDIKIPDIEDFNKLSDEQIGNIMSMPEYKVTATGSDGFTREHSNTYAEVNRQFKTLYDTTKDVLDEKKETLKRYRKEIPDDNCASRMHPRCNYLSDQVRLDRIENEKCYYSKKVRNNIEKKMQNLATEMENILAKNIINVEDCSVTLLKRKVTMQYIARALESLFPEFE